jgi:hypothetical protein
MNRNIAERFTDTTAATCHTGTGIADLTSKIADCISTNEKTRNAGLASLFRLTDEIGDLKSTINNSLIMGDNMFGTAGHHQISKEMKHRNDELKLKRATLKKEIEKKYQMVQTSNRDFSDHLEPTNTSAVLSVEDYTVFIFVLSYLFMACVGIYTYTMQSESAMKGFGKAFVATVLTTIIGGMVFYSVA